MPQKCSKPRSTFAFEAVKPRLTLDALGISRVTEEIDALEPTDEFGDVLGTFRDVASLLREAKDIGQMTVLAPFA